MTLTTTLAPKARDLTASAIRDWLDRGDTASASAALTARHAADLANTLGAFETPEIARLLLLLGMSLPFLLSRLNIDPATASAPLVTSIADAAGVLICFGLAYDVFGFAGRGDGGRDGHGDPRGLGRAGRRADGGDVAAAKRALFRTRSRVGPRTRDGSASRAEGHRAVTAIAARPVASALVMAFREAEDRRRDAFHPGLQL